MATEALSQSEIDALMSQSQGRTGSEDDVGKKDKAVFTYNFRKQKKFNKNDFVLLESIHKRFLRNIEVTLTNILSTPIMATLAAATELSYSDCMDSFSSPTCIYILTINTNLGKFILEIDPNFAFFVIDKILGGNSREIRTMDRELSMIEEKIMNRVVNFLLSDLMDAWARVEKLQIDVDAFYAQPDYVQVISNTETVILVSMDVRSSDKTLGYINLCLPSTVLEGIVLKYDRNSDTTHVVGQSREDRKNLERRIHESLLPIRVVLGQTQMAVNELLNIDRGDIIYLHTEARNPVDVFVSNVKMYKGRPVSKDSSMAVQITEVTRAQKDLPSL